MIIYSIKWRRSTWIRWTIWCFYSNAIRIILFYKTNFHCWYVNTIRTLFIFNFNNIIKCISRLSKKITFNCKSFHCSHLNILETKIKIRWITENPYHRKVNFIIKNCISSYEFSLIFPFYLISFCTRNFFLWCTEINILLFQW